jgi:hypothetical protein
MDKKRAAQQAREDMMKELADEVSQSIHLLNHISSSSLLSSCQAERKKAAVLRFPNPLHAAKRMFRNFSRFVDEANVRERERESRVKFLSCPLI